MTYCSMKSIRNLYNKHLKYLLHHRQQFTPILLKRNELRRVSSTNTRTVVLNRGVRNSKLSKVVTDHLSLDFNVVEGLAIVNTNDGANHLRNNKHVTEVSLNSFRTFVLRAFSLLNINSTNNHYSLAKSLQEGIRLSLKTTAETTAGTSLQQH